MEQFELVPLKNGVISLRALEPRETFHPGIGPAEEARILHVEQQRICERAQQMSEFHLWDVGLGAGANAIAALRVLQQSTQQQKTKITLCSFDKTTSPMRFALQHAQALGYLTGFEAQVEELLEVGRVQMTPHLIWELRLGDFNQLLRDTEMPAPDAIFYDPYSITGNPEMWTLDHFSRLYTKLDPVRSCLWTNYTRSTQVRVSLLLAGFYVGIGCGIHEKDETTIASNRLEDLQRPLDRSWLEKRVRISHNAAPLRSAVYQIAPIAPEDFEQLLRHPQFG